MKHTSFMILAWVLVCGYFHQSYAQVNPDATLGRSTPTQSAQPSITINALLDQINLESSALRDTREYSDDELQLLNAYRNSLRQSSISANALLLEEAFDDVTTLEAAGYSFVNASDVAGISWFQGADGVLPSQSGDPTAYIGVNYNSTEGTVVNNFMITPVLNLENGDEIIFWTRVTAGSTFPDRLEVRLSPDGANIDPASPTDVGSYTELLLEINPALAVGGYPEDWMMFTATVTGLTGAVDTRVAFRYWVTDSGLSGNNGDYIGIDTLTISEAANTPADPSIATVLDIRTLCGDEFGTFSVDGPYTIDSVGTITSSIFAGDFDGNNVLYAMNNNDLTLITIDAATGLETTVGPLTNLVTGHTTTGLAYNADNGIMYLLSGLDDDVTLYSVDLATGTLTQVGTSTVAGLVGIWLAIDENGNAFMADIVSDSLFSVDLSDGSVTLIGALGININFAQDADFDPATGILYMGAYTGAGTNQWASVDTTTGAATSLGSVNMDCAELSIVAIRGEVANETACNEENPSNGIEDGYFSGSGPGAPAQVTATDLTIASDIDFSLTSVNANLGIDGFGETITGADIVIYGDTGGLPDTSNIIAEYLGVVPVSQLLVGTAFGTLEVLDVTFNIPATLLAGQAGATTTYWISIYSTASNSGNVFWEVTTASVIGNGAAISFDNATTWADLGGGFDMVYNFSGECTPIIITPLAFPITFESQVIPFNDFNGSATQEIANPDATGVNTSVNVAENLVVANAAFAGVTIVIPVDLADDKFFSMDVWSPIADIPVLLKLEGGPNPPIERQVNMTTSAAWEKIIFDFSSEEALTYESVTIFMNFNRTDSANQTFYWDNLERLSSETACNEENASNNFEAGSLSGSGSAAPAQIIATDLTIASDIDFSLTSVNAILGIEGFDETITSADIVIYGDTGGLPDTANIIASYLGVVPVSQPAVGPAFGVYELLDVTFNIPATLLSGQAGATTTYWVSVYSTASNAVNVFWEATTVSVIGNGAAISSDNATTWADLEGGFDMVYNFSGECTPMTLSLDRAALSNFSFYPNPAQERLNLNAQQAIEQVTIFNMLGQIMLDQSVGVSNTQIDISNLATGNYFMQVFIDGQKGVYKLLKQ